LLIISLISGFSGKRLILFSVTIWNEHESQFVTSLFADIVSKAWLGLSYVKESESSRPLWTWDDQFPLVFTNWGGEIGTPGLSGCVEFSDNGQWITSSSCKEQLPFICKIENSYDPNISEDLGEATCDPTWFLIPSDKAMVKLITLYYKTLLKPTVVASRRLE
jgi:hypothetical protein